MKLFISDLHLGSPLFDKSFELIKLFRREDIDEIYLVGDIFDSWEMDPLEGFYIYESLVTEINFINKPVFILKGNHDPNIDVLKEIFFNVSILKSIELELCGKNVLITHGHEACTDSKIAHKLFFIQYYSQRLLKWNPKATLRDVWVKWLLFKDGLNENSIILKIEKEIFDFYRGKYDVIICGHTHVPKIVYNKELTYVNTGCIIHKPTYLLVDGCSFLLEDLI